MGRALAQNAVESSSQKNVYFLGPFSKTRRLKKSLKKSKINIETWHELALDCSAWKNAIENLKVNQFLYFYIHFYIYMYIFFLCCDLYSFTVKPIPIIGKASVCLSVCLSSIQLSEGNFTLFGLKVTWRLVSSMGF